MAYFQYGAAFAGGSAARGPAGDVAAVGIVNGKSRYAQQPVAKRFIESGSEAVVCHMRVAYLGNAIIEVWNPAFQVGHTAAAATASTGLCQAAARQGFLRMILAASFEAYGIDENTAAQLPIRDGVPSADAAYQCMRIATKTLQNPRARLQGEEYAGVFAVSTLAPNLALANSYVIPTQNMPGRHLPRWGTVPVPVFNCVVL